MQGAEPAKRQLPEVVKFGITIFDLFTQIHEAWQCGKIVKRCWQCNWHFVRYVMLGCQKSHIFQWYWLEYTVQFVNQFSSHVTCHRYLPCDKKFWGVPPKVARITSRYKTDEMSWNSGKCHTLWTYLTKLNFSRPVRMLNYTLHILNFKQILKL